MAEKEKIPLTARLKFLFGIGDCGFSLMTNVETFYFQFFLTNIAQFTVGVMGVITSVISIVDASLSWIYGGVLNIVKPRKTGRYRPWLIMIPWIVPFLFMFQFIKISDNIALSATIICIAGVVSHVVWNLPYAANMAMISIAGQTPQGRASLASSRATWNNIASVAFSYVGLPLATLLSTMNIMGDPVKVGNATYRALSFGVDALILGIFMALTYWVHYIITKGYEPPEEITKANESKTKTSFKDMALALFANPHLILLIIADLAKWCVKFVVAGCAMYYWTYVGSAASGQTALALQTSYVLISALCAVAGAYTARFFTKAFTNKYAMVYAYIVMAIALILAYFMYSQWLAVFILMCVGQFGYGVCYACAPALYADAAVYAEWKTGKNNVGWVMGLQTLPLKISVILKAVIIAVALSAVGFSAKIDPKTATDALKQGITAGFALVPGILLVVGVVILIFGFRLTKEKVAKYQAEIDARK